MTHCAAPTLGAFASFFLEPAQSTTNGIYAELEFFAGGLYVAREEMDGCVDVRVNDSVFAERCVKKRYHSET